MLGRIKLHLYSGEFSNRLRRRHQVLWQEAEPLKKLWLTKNNSIDDWRDENLWQRRLSNKLNAKEFAQLHGAKTSALYWKGRDVERIDFASLPAQYVIRPTFGSGCTGVFLMDNGFNLFDNKYYSEQEIVAILRKNVKELPNQCILVEEFLTNEAGKHVIPTDYKFFCFNGKIAGLSVINRQGPHDGTSAFFNEHWIPMEPLTISYPYPYKFGQSKPKCFEEMVEQVKKLSKLYGIFVRIDFYATSNGPVFGEFTPTPGLGRGFTKYAEKLFTLYWDEHCPGQI
ncbi:MULTISPECIES: ATP-grasp fold amidoligase family protein [Olivibacter]|jgi:hypothetical protein|uniref:ATP-grasp fold amidoligase family protein n=1 Tax=Olivibacter oleidegradans TaxID=760123 RepID=A0ABV6HGG6_9SPHI|nr:MULTISPECIES: ATP-grasp fold amidoligase family protein [Olivibacter]MDM8176624.1 ATP-grasp fold amidoligase family protein [Olivibacter sp. 47]QEL00457.1 hypothetical protein FKG96_06410 [Olivibacter sp. LS-1]